MLPQELEVEPRDFRKGREDTQHDLKMAGIKKGLMIRVYGFRGLGFAVLGFRVLGV